MSSIGLSYVNLSSSDQKSDYIDENQTNSNISYASNSSGCVGASSSRESVIDEILSSDGHYKCDDDGVSGGQGTRTTTSL